MKPITSFKDTAFNSIDCTVKPNKIDELFCYYHDFNKSLLNSSFLQMSNYDVTGTFLNDETDATIKNNQWKKSLDMNIVLTTLLSNGYDVRQYIKAVLAYK